MSRTKKINHYINLITLFLVTITGYISLSMHSDNFIITPNLSFLSKYKMYFINVLIFKYRFS